MKIHLTKTDLPDPSPAFKAAKATIENKKTAFFITDPS